MTALAPILQGFFTDKLIRQRRAGPNTIAAYRDTCRLLLEFAFRTTGPTTATKSLAHHRHSHHRNHRPSSPHAESSLKTQDNCQSPSDQGSRPRIASAWDITSRLAS
jgi:hypothetical protein